MIAERERDEPTPAPPPPDETPFEDPDIDTIQEGDEGSERG